MSALPCASRLKPALPERLAAQQSSGRSSFNMASKPSFFLDTNVLLYALSHADAEAEAEAEKRRIARQWLQRVDWGLSTQVLMEFYVNAIKPRHGLPPGTAQRMAQRLAAARPVQAVDAKLALDAMQWQQALTISPWDAAILCAAHRLGAATVVSEDLSHGQVYSGVRVLNPFMEA